MGFPRGRYLIASFARFGSVSQQRKPEIPVVSELIAARGFDRVGARASRRDQRVVAGTGAMSAVRDGPGRGRRWRSGSVPWMVEGKEIRFGRFFAGS